MTEKEYKKEIIEMVNEIENADFLIYIYSFIKPMLKKVKGISSANSLQ